MSGNEGDATQGLKNKKNKGIPKLRAEMKQQSHFRMTPLFFEKSLSRRCWVIPSVFSATAWKQQVKFQDKFR